MPVYRLGNGDDSFDSANLPDWTDDSQVFGGNGNDAITARALNFSLNGTLRISGGNGDDTLRLDAGNSFAFGGSGDDTLTSTGGLDNTLSGGNGDDLLVSVGGGSGMGRGNTPAASARTPSASTTPATSSRRWTPATTGSCRTGTCSWGRRTRSPTTGRGNSSSCAPISGPKTFRPTRASTAWR